LVVTSGNGTFIEAVKMRTFSGEQYEDNLASDLFILISPHRLPTAEETEYPLMETNSEAETTDELYPSGVAQLPQPFSSLVKVDLYALSDQGHIRTNNEDHYLVVRCGRALETLLTNLTGSKTGDIFEETLYGFAVADGLGGEAAGEIASREAIQTLLSLVLQNADWRFRWGTEEMNAVKSRMTDRFRRVNAALLQQSANDPDLAGMSTTMTVAVTFGNSLIVTHIGDSRAYLLHGGKLTKLTRDL
jgi:PPM family protein phosphatase